MRTLLSHDATLRKSAVGENASSEMLSSGGLLSATSFEMSPVVLGVLAVALVLVKSDILPKAEELSLVMPTGRGYSVESRSPQDIYQFSGLSRQATTFSADATKAAATPSC